jgi:hypothetical protein
LEFASSEPCKAWRTSRASSLRPSLVSHLEDSGRNQMTKARIMAGRHWKARQKRHLKEGPTLSSVKLSPKES